MSSGVNKWLKNADDMELNKTMVACSCLSKLMVILKWSWKDILREEVKEEADMEREEVEDGSNEMIKNDWMIEWRLLEIKQHKY